MPTDISQENNLSKDELLEILNEIDTESIQNDSRDTNGNPKEHIARHRYPNPGNPFH